MNQLSIKSTSCTVYRYLALFVTCLLASAAQAAAPQINGLPSLKAEIGTPYTFDLQASDADNDPLTYYVGSWPSGLDIHISDQGVVSFDSDDRHVAGKYMIFTRVEDGLSGEDTLNYWLTIEDPSNRAPVINNPAITEATIGTTYSYDLQASDADNDTLTYRVGTWPSGLDVDISNQGVISWDLDDPNDAGQYVIFVSVDDGNLGIEHLRYELSVVNPQNVAPVINNPPVQQATVGTVYTYDLQATDANNDDLSYSIGTWPSGLDVTISEQGVITWDLDDPNDAGKYVIYARVEDGNQGVENLRYNLSVTNPNNRTPVVNSPSLQEAIIGSQYRYDLRATDADNDPLTYYVSSWPSSLNVTISDTGVITWDVGLEQETGRFVIYARVDDGNQGIKNLRYEITVVEPRSPLDSDGDGFADSDDVFPYDPLQNADSNGDGVGDNTVSSQRISYTYNENGQILTIDGPRTDVDDITTYTYDTNGNLTAIINALGHTTTLSEHNGRGQPQRIIDANGIETALTYHVRGWLLSQTVNPEGYSSTTQYTYDSTGQLTQITLPEGEVFTYTYDTSNRLIAMSNSLGERIDYSLDNAGNRLSQTISADGQVAYQMTHAYDELSRLMTTIGADGQTTDIDYDVNGNAINTTNPRGYTQGNTVDPLNRLTQQQDANAGTTQFTYDDHDRLTSVTDANGNTTHYTYDALGHLIEQDSPDTGITRFAYDHAGNPVVSVDSRGIVTRYTYDALNRLTQTIYPTAPEENVTYTYDVVEYTHDNGETYTPIQAIGRLFRIEDPSGVQFYGYDDNGNVRTHIQAIGHDATDPNLPVHWTNYLYDRSGNLEGIDRYIGEDLVHYVDYHRDSTGRVIGVEYGTESNRGLKRQLVDNITYQPLGPISQIDYANGITTQHTYDQDYRLTRQQAQADSDIIIDRGYQYDANGNITVIEQNNTEPAVSSFGYDALDRLDRTEKGIDHGVSEPISTAVYTYDPVGNRLTEAGSQTSETNGLINYSDDYGYLLGGNILADIERSMATTTRTTYTVDERGNTTGIQLPGESITLSYNAANRPERVIVNGVTTDYQYNALGQRVIKTQNGQSTHYLYNLQGQLIGEYRDDGQPLVEYLYLNGQPLAQLRNGQAYYYHNDHLGTPQKITNQNQEVVWQADYTAFGEATLTTDVVENSLRFAGQYFDQETGFHYNYFRTYDPSTGRYLQSDPIGLQGGINTYLYANANPIIFTDPFGLAPLDPSGKNGLPGGTIGSRAGPKPPSAAEKAGGFAAKQALKNIANAIVPGAGKLIGSSPLGVLIGGITFSTPVACAALDCDGDGLIDHPIEPEVDQPSDSDDPCIKP